MTRFFGILFAAVLYTSCLSNEQNAAQREKVIAKGVEIELEEFRKRHDRDCRSKIVDLAVTQVDSLVRAGYLIPRVDPVDKPPKPPKPGKPVLKTLPDSLSMQMLRDSN